MIPKPGIYSDVPVPVYRSWEAANFSFLRHFRRSAAHAREEQLHPSAPTEAMTIGAAVHAAILEPDQFPRRYCCGIQVDRRTKAGKAEWAAFEAENTSKEILKPEAWRLCKGISEALWTHPLASAILKSPGSSEVSAVWTDRDTESVLCKARMDRVGLWDRFTWVWDLKKTQDASPRGFRRALAAYDIHCQGAHYLDALNTLDPRPRRFGVIAVEEKPPHCIGIYEVEEPDLEQGRWEVSQWLSEYKDARETDCWPGYAQSIQPIALPVWRRREYEYGE